MKNYNKLKKAINKYNFKNYNYVKKHFKIFKKMKNFQKSLFAVTFSALLFSCSNDEPVGTGSTTAATGSTYEVVAPTALPSTALTYIASNYSGASTTEVNLVSDGTYVAYVSKTSGATDRKSVV